MRNVRLWLDHAVPQVPRRLNQHRDHLIVCGDDALAYRVVEELTVNYGERVTVLLSSAARRHGPRIAQLPAVRVIERPELDTEACNTISRSVSYLAAPAFAAAMLEHQVLRTIPVGRHVLLIADFLVSAGSELAGEPVESVHETSEVRVIALRRAAAEGVDWSPRRITG
jgi:hypothetical protein